MHKPPGAGFATLHAKTWCCDGEVYLGGSVNFTRKSVENSFENLVIVKDVPVITKYMEWFESIWAVAEELE